MLDEYFKTTDMEKDINIKQAQEKQNAKIQFVNGSQYHQSIYDIDEDKGSNIKFYQIAQFDEFGNVAIRSFEFKGIKSNGVCFYDYKMESYKDHILPKRKAEKFVRFLDKLIKKTPTGAINKIIYKYYPVYNFDYTAPPDGSELSQCCSELLK